VPKSRFSRGASLFIPEFDTPVGGTAVKRNIEEKICEAWRRLRESSKTGLKRDRDKFRNQQERSLEPEVYDDIISGLDDKLAATEDEGLRDLHVFLLYESEKDWSFQRVGDEVYKEVKSRIARRSRAPRAWGRANAALESGPDRSAVVDAMTQVGSIFSPK
jgi:hypothetical protein